MAPSTGPQAAQPLNLTQPIPPPAGVPQPPPGQPVNVQRVSLTGEVISTPSAVDPTVYNAAPQGYAPPAAPAPGYPNAYAGMPTAAVTPLMVRDRSRAMYPQVSWGERFELFLAISLPILLASMFLVHSVPSLMLWVFVGDTFLLSLIMGATGAIPSFEDAMADVAIMLVVTFLLGPLIALGVHLIVGMFKQEWNGAIIGLLVLNIVIYQFLLWSMFTSDALSIYSFLRLGMTLGLIGLVTTFSIFLSFGAWMLSSFFRPIGAD